MLPIRSTCGEQLALRLLINTFVKKAIGKHLGHRLVKATFPNNPGQAQATCYSCVSEALELILLSEFCSNHMFIHVITDLSRFWCWAIVVVVGLKA